MELNEIIMDSLVYPSQNIKSLIVYIFISIIMGIVMVATGVSAILIPDLISSTLNMTAVTIIVLLIGFIVTFALFCLIEGYGLDIIKIASNRGTSAPEVDFTRQVSTGFKYLIVCAVYLIIPIILTIILSLFLQRWLVYIIGFILFVIFLFALSMAECRLANSLNLGYALDFNGAINDLQAIGVSKVVITIIATTLVSLILTIVVTFIFGLIGSDIITSIVSSILSVYMVFFTNRAMGLLYSTR